MSGTSRSGSWLRTVLATAAAAAFTFTGLGAQAEASPPRPAAGETFFDDFNYAGHTDPTLAEHGWRVRSGGGGPGVPGATWAPENVTFARDGDNSLMNLETSTAGTGESTRETEVHTEAMKFRNGTYAARVRFSDAPRSGPDGDRVNQTFFTINDLKAPMADDYSEYDFEYLPNGGWGQPGNTLYTTSWETFQEDPWVADNASSSSATSFDGWHDLVLTIDDQRITYYVDGQQFGQHGAKYLPERPMMIDFNQWLIDFDGLSSTESRTYDQKVDYVLHVKDQVLSPAQVGERLDALRAAGKTFTDEVPAP